MAHGREIRLPFLNHELVSFLFSLPVRFKINQGFTKWILRKAMEDRLPGAIVWRKDKVGYEPPQKTWMENLRLQDKIHESKRSLVKAGIITEEATHKKIQPLDSHAADNYDWRFLVTDLLLHQ
jgi:asparagine synthase (glutamine-hydrolysing)